MGGRGARSPRAHVRPRRCEDGRLGDRGRACRCTPDAPRPYTVFTALVEAGPACMTFSSTLPAAPVFSSPSTPARAPRAPQPRRARSRPGPQARCLLTPASLGTAHAPSAMHMRSCRRTLAPLLRVGYAAHRQRIAIREMCILIWQTSMRLSSDKGGMLSVPAMPGNRPTPGPRWTIGVL